MQVSIAELRPGAAAAFSFETDAEELGAQAEGYAFLGTILLDGRAENTGTGYRVTGTIRATKRFACDRCLEETEERQEIPFDETFREDAADGDEATPFSGDAIPLDALARDTLTAYQPIQQLCKKDCKGLCPVCGANLNHGECSCDRFVPDPRLAALENFRWDEPSR